MTSPGGGAPAGCANPIDETVLLDYWLALLPAAEQDAVEEHLFDCDGCGDRLRESIALAQGLRALARSGALLVVVGEDLVRRAVEGGLRVREYASAPGETVLCTIAADDDLLIARLAADLRGAPRVDVSFCDAQGTERRRMTDIPVRHEAGSIILHESVPFAKQSPTTMMITRLLAVEVGGGERVIGEYMFRHTRTIPGLPGWEW